MTELEILNKWLNKFYSTAGFNEQGELLFTKQQIERIDNLKIEMYANEHNPPHFHVKSKNGEINASFRLDNCTLFKGNISSNDRKIVEEFYKNKKQLLFDYFNNNIIKRP